MQSILGALLTAGYASAIAAAIAAAPNQAEITDNVQAELQKSFASAADTAQQYPQYSNEIISAATSSFLDGADWAYGAGIIAIVLGAVLVFFCYPRRDEAERLLAEYHVEDSAAGAGATQAA
jgi:MFS transporter, DHA2 family, multidrug resistance protein